MQITAQYLHTDGITYNFSATLTLRNSETDRVISEPTGKFYVEDFRINSVDSDSPEILGKLYKLNMEDFLE